MEKTRKTSVSPRLTADTNLSMGVRSLSLLTFTITSAGCREEYTDYRTFYLERNGKLREVSGGV